MEEERLGVFIDYDNLAIGARDEGLDFDFKPIAEALADRGRVVVRRAYADWTSWDEDRRMLARNQVELIEMPQRMGAVRKNAADIKMSVDAIELAFEREYITTFVICSGDSDFTPLVHKLRELNRRVVGVGLKGSTSPLLPAACDEFLFYERLHGVEARASDQRGQREETDNGETGGVTGDLDSLAALLTRTLAGLQGSSEGPVRSSYLKRALLRKDPTFTEADYGFRAFGELLRNVEERGVVALDQVGQGDPVVTFPEAVRGEAAAFSLLRDTVADLEKEDGPVALSGLKNELRKRESDFNERRFGFSGFLQFAKAAQARGLIDLAWDDDLDDYSLTAGTEPGPE